MSDTYHYDEGAIHNDHKRVIHIDTIGGADLVKLIGAFFNNNAEDAVVVEADDIQVKERAAVLTGNAEFMAIMEKAVEQGFCSPKGWQYRWRVKADAAYFASVASHQFDLSDRHDHDGDKAISWIPFETLFAEKGLRLTYNDIKQCKTTLKHKAEIDKLFR